MRPVEDLPTDDPPVSVDRRRLATVELLGVVTYAQLRAFQVTASALAKAPSAREAHEIAGYAVEEHAAYLRLLTHLRSRTELAAAVVDRQKATVDAFFDAAPMDEWLSACVFFVVGLPIAADFIRQIGPSLQDETADVVVDALANREDFEAFATDVLRREINREGDGTQRVRDLVADVVGRALTSFQGAIADTDALQILLSPANGEDVEGGAAADVAVRRMAVQVLEGHRARMHALGIQDYS